MWVALLVLLCGPEPGRAVTNGVPWTDAVNPDAGRCLLSRATHYTQLGSAVFEVPVQVVESYFMDTMADRPAPLSDAPVAALPSRWQVNLLVASNRPSVRLECAGTAFRATPSAPVKVGLFPANAAYEDLRLNGKATVPTDLRDCWVTVPVTEPGDFLITATLAVKPIENGPDRSLTFSAGEFASRAVRIDSDQEIEARIANGVGRVAGTPERGTHGILAVDRAGPFTVTWRKPEAVTARTGLASVKPSLAWTVGTKTLAASGLLDVDILGGAMDKMAVTVPPGADKIQVSGADVKYFTRNGTRVDIFFRGALGGRTSVLLSFEAPRPRGNLVACPEVEIPGGRLDKGGWLIVANDGEGQLLEQTIQGFEPTAVLQVPAEVLGLLPGRPLFAYARTGYRGQAVFDHVATTPFPLVDTIADRTEAVAVFQPAGDEMARVRYTVRNSHRQFLRMTLPERARLLWATVEKKPVRPTGDGREIMIPLLKSVQAIEGLVSFPVEIIYSRGGAPLAGAARHVVDLPELTDVPTALVNVTVFAPDGLDVKGTGGTLRMVRQFATGGAFTYGHGFVRPGESGAMAKPDGSLVLHALSARYYESGYEAYRQGRFEDAEDMLANVEKSAPDSGQAADARNLLASIRAGRGELGGKNTREDRAKAINVQKGMQTDNPFLEKQQSAMVLNAVKMIQTGNEELGAQWLDEAEAMGRKLLQRGGSQVEQKAVVGQFKDKLGDIRTKKKENEELTQRLSQLQKKAMEISTATGNGKAAPAKARNFAYALSEAAAANDVAADEIQGVAFGTAAAPAQPRPDLDEKVIALQTQAPVNGDAPVPNAPAAQRGGRSLERENVRLRRQVVTMEQAVKKVEAPEPAPTAAAKPTINDLQLREARRQVARVAETAESLARQAEGPEVTAETTSGKALTDRIAALRKTTDALQNTFGGMDPALDSDVQSTRGRFATIESRLEAALERKKKAPTVTINLDGVVQADSRAEQEGLVKFLHDNYLPQSRNGQAQFEVAHGQLTVRNEENNPAVLGEAIAKLRLNRGLAVPVTGRTLPVSSVGDLPVLGKLFATRTGDGKRAAILDEAQYRVLLEAAGKVDETDRREVVVGTPNRAAGEDFRISRNGKDYNGIELGGVEIRVPNNRYLAVDNGTSVSVIKAGAAATWQTADAANVPTSTLTVGSPPEVPQVGTPLFFEKTLLAAGESPDIVITYSYKERR